jgi:hypothetical protein
MTIEKLIFELKFHIELIRQAREAYFQGHPGQVPSLLVEVRDLTQCLIDYAEDHLETQQPILPTAEPERKDT